jgi:hypothetical protein
MPELAIGWATVAGATPRQLLIFILECDFADAAGA